MKSQGEVEHIELRRGDLLNEKFKVLNLLGDGTFGRVVECEYRGVTFAVKVNLLVSRSSSLCSGTSILLKLRDQSSRE